MSPTGQLSKDGLPVLLLGGQTYNSSSSSVASIGSAFAHARRMNANTVLAPVSWSQLEPTEGQFRFELVDTMLDAARAEGLHLVPLWFGAFKNAASTYAPNWVRSDSTRFPRAVIEVKGLQAFTYLGATAKPVLSVFSEALRSADAAAFEALMSHIATVDSDGVVAMVQVENESGLLSDSRDRSVGAEAAWTAPVPDLLAQWVSLERAKGTIARRLWEAQGQPAAGAWGDMFGTGWEADEVFMAWGFASYVEHLAQRAHCVLTVPLYANAWLGPQPGQVEAGQWPSGGPTARVLDIWRLTAPTLAFLGPDIYVDDVEAPMQDYTAGGHPLFIPESRYTAAGLLRAVGTYRAVGWSAFGIDGGNPEGQVAATLGYLNALSEAVLAAQTARTIAAVVIDDEDVALRLGELEVTARGTRALYQRMLLDAGVRLPPEEVVVIDETLADVAVPHRGEKRPFGLIFLDETGTVTVIGQGLTLDFFREGHHVEFDTIVEGLLEEGVYTPGRELNGDERLRILPLDRVGAARLTLLTLTPEP